MSTGWQTRKLKELTTKIGSGSTPRGGEAVYKTSGVPLIRSMNVHFAGFKTDGIAYLDDREAAKLDHVTVQADDVLLNITGASIGRVTTAPASMAGSRVNQHVCIVRPKTELSPRYLAQFLASPSQQARVMNVQVGVTRQALTKAMIENWDIPLPSLDEQQQIVAEIEKQFTRLEVGVAGLRRVQVNLKRYRAAVLKAACEGKLVPTEAELARQEGRTYETGGQLLERILTERRQKWSGKGKYKEPPAPAAENLPKLPEGWTWASVEQISTKVVDGVHKKPEYVSSGIPFVTVRNLTFGPGISFEKLNYVTRKDHLEFVKRANPERGDILVSKDGTLGVIRVVKTDVEFSIFVSVALVKPVLKQMSSFLETALSSAQVQVQMVPKGSGLQHIHLEDLREDCVPLPSLAEQQRIVAEVERRLSVVEEFETVVNANLQRATRLRQAILQQSFSRQADLSAPL